MHEFRVVWQREGRQRSTRIYQTEKAARRKVDGLLAMDEIKGDIPAWEDMPDLVGVPAIEVREVGAWEPHVRQPLGEPSARAREGVEAWAGLPGDSGGVF